MRGISKKSFIFKENGQKQSLSGNLKTFPYQGLPPLSNGDGARNNFVEPYRLSFHLVVKALKNVVMSELCAQCNLPLPKNHLKAEIEGDSYGFCCYGCWLTLQITSQKGEEGKSRMLLIRLGTGAFFAMYVMLFSVPLYFPDLIGNDTSLFLGLELESVLRWLLFLLSTPVILLLGIPILKSSLNSLKRTILNLDVLIVLGTVTAYGLSAYHTLSSEGHVYYDTATVLLVLFTLGRYLEAHSKAGASESLTKLIRRQEGPVTVIRRGKERIVPVEEVRIGDKVKLKPGDCIPVDGNIVEGKASVDESSLTGESMPVFKAPGSPVYSGTFCVDGVVIVRAKKVNAESTAARIAQLLQKVQNSPMPLLKIADRVAGYFIPLIVAVAAGSFLLWYLRAGAEKALLTSLSVLVVSCPCALIIATPIAIWIALGEITKKGILIKNGDILQKLPQIRSVFFDKTGTLSTNRLRYAGMITDPETSLTEKEILSKTLPLVKNSNHPISAALLNGNPTFREYIPIREFRNFPGMGISGKIDGDGSQEIYVGSLNFMKSQHIFVSDVIEAQLKKFHRGGRTSALVAWNGGVKALLIFEETLKPEAGSSIQSLLNMGLQVSILTGDTKPTEKLGSQLSPAVKIWGGLLPEEKLESVTQGRSSGKLTAMIGDGLNDAPALAGADVGIAVGTGADLTRKAADINLISENLRLIPWLMKYSNSVKKRIIENLFWAFFYNSFAVIIAALGWLNPVVAVTAMIFSSLFVIGNSRRLRKTPPV